ncbi:MAG: hypothetical protein ABI475_05380 [Methylophilaceae bacterium]
MTTLGAKEELCTLVQQGGGALVADIRVGWLIRRGGRRGFSKLQNDPVPLSFWIKADARPWVIVPMIFTEARIKQ